MAFWDKITGYKYETYISQHQSRALVGLAKALLNECDSIVIGKAGNGDIQIVLKKRK